MSEKTEGREGAERIREIFEPVKSAPIEGGGKVHELNAWRHHLDQGEKGVKRNLTNLMVHLRHIKDLGKNIRFNEQSQYPEWKGRKLADHDFIDIRMLIEREGFQPTEGDVRPAVVRLAHEHSYNPIVEYLDSLKWDGHPRLDRWMREFLGAPDDDFTSLVSSKALIAAVARVVQPGCQVDTMVVLEGDQGIRKSSAIQELFTPQYAFEVTSGFDKHRELVPALLGAWCVELAEFVSVAKSNVGAVKGLISMRSDRVVLPYGRTSSDLPRRIVFWGTINPGASGYLTDVTGNRRYWPIHVTKVDIAGIRNSRDQLWAEAMHRYRQGERWWLEGDENKVAQAVQGERMMVDPWADILVDKLVPGQRYSSPEILTKMLFAPTDRQDVNINTRLAGVMTGLGWTNHPPSSRKDENGVWRSIRLWKVKEAK